ncbi:cytochrome P450 [Armillaria nabsnona]|nr:cytochrome P450 [Armillaria nabsnona]
MFLSDPQMVSTLFLGLLLLAFWQYRRKLLCLPPGPSRRHPGDHALVFQPWKTFYQWNKTYGPVISFALGRKRVIVLGTFQAARDLLGSRGSIYSGRPRNIVGHEILSGGMRGIGMSDGPRYRKWKTLMQAGLNNTVALNYQPLQSLESFLLLRDLLTDEDVMEYKQRLRRFAISIIFCVAYGRRIKTLDDDIVVRNMKTDGYFGKIHVPGKFLVDSWPILLWLPKFLQWFRWEPERHRALDTELYMALLDDVRQQMQKGTAYPSMASHGLEKQEEFGLSDEETAFTLSAPWAAGPGTTVATIEIFLLAMLLYPDAMKKAQIEIDSVVGMERMPGFNDLKVLPYLEALIKETTRWRCVAPTGFPHAPMSDDFYEGMFIPKGSTVYANIYAITQDEVMFPNPGEFIPERFLNTSDPNLINFTIPFGFGRRQCPGMHVALQSVFIAVARILWAFNITPPVDSQGNKILPSADSFTSGLITRPTPFKCCFEPRSQNAREVIIQEAERAELEASAWKS